MLIISSIFILPITGQALLHLKLLLLSLTILGPFQTSLRTLVATTFRKEYWRSCMRTRKQELRSKTLVDLKLLLLQVRQAWLIHSRSRIFPNLTIFALYSRMTSGDVARRRRKIKTHRLTD